MTQRNLPIIFNRRLLLAFLAGIGLASPALAADPIKIGVTIAQSPPGSVIQGTQVLDALQVTQKIINDGGGVLGRPIELVVEDTQGLPEKARAAVEKLITLDKVVAITGEHQSSNVLAGMEVAHHYHIPYMNVNGWADAIRAKGYIEEFNPANYSTRTAVAMADAMKRLGAKRVVALAENTDYGIGAAKSLGDQLKIAAPDIQFSYETLDRTAKDFSPVILSLKANPPDAIVEVMLPPAAYLALNQLYEQGVAPTAKTWLYDGSGLADYPDFWQNVQEAAKDMIVFGLYHPKMAMPPIGKKVAAAYTAKTHNEPNRLLFQSADSLFLLAEAIKTAKSTDPDAMIKALEAIKWEGTRGVVTFSTEPGYKYHQWIDIPYITFQITAVKQPMEDTRLVQEPGQPLDVSKLEKPAK
ncbi:MAG: ABC transporter substrate-binding protein [Xanthobacteraceae bacterium]|jgi:branched-chain amino acid transport system substrate-binding protein